MMIVGQHVARNCLILRQQLGPIGKSALEGMLQRHNRGPRSRVHQRSVLFVSNAGNAESDRPTSRSSSKPLAFLQDG